jgi:hypothetical protein
MSIRQNNDSSEILDQMKAKLQEEAKKSTQLELKFDKQRREIDDMTREL